jgi:hypothetical protein
MELTNEERIVGDRAVSKFEKRARELGRECAVLLILGIVGMSYGSTLFVNSLLFGFESGRGQIQRYMNDARRLPNGAERDIWMVDTFRSSAMILEDRFGGYKIAVMNAVIGLLIAVLGATSAVTAVIKWNSKPQRLLLAKLIRAKWEEEIIRS